MRLPVWFTRASVATVGTVLLWSFLSTVGFPGLGVVVLFPACWVLFRGYVLATPLTVDEELKLLLLEGS